MPTDPTPTPTLTPREAVRQWWDAVSGLDHSDSESNKDIDVLLAALAATGDAPLAGPMTDDEYAEYLRLRERIELELSPSAKRCLTELVGQTFSVIGRNVVGNRDLAAQLAAARAERDALRAQVDATNSVDGVSPDDAPEWVCELPAATAWREGVEHGQDMVLDALATPARPTDTGRDG